MSPESIAAAADEIVAELGDGPGVVLAVAADGGEPIVRAGGFADLGSRQPITPQTALPIASITKQMTGMCAAVLDTQGVLSLDAPVSDYVSGLPELVGRPTIRQLLSHRSGLRCHLDHQLFSGVSARPRGFSMRAIRACSSVNAEPGQLMVYGNGGFHLAGQAIEAASGSDFGSVMKEVIFDVLGMSSTRIVPEGAGREHGLACLYMPAAEGWDDYSFLRHESLGEGGAWSTVGDLLIWMKALRTEDPRLPQEAWRALKTAPRLPDDSAANYGLGLSITNFRGLDILGHGGAIAGANSAVLSAVDYPVDVAVLSNGMFPTDQFAKRLLAAAVGEERLAPPRAGAMAADAQALLGAMYGNGEVTLAFADADGALGMSIQGSPPLPLQQGDEPGTFAFEGGLSPSGVRTGAPGAACAPDEVQLQFGGRIYALPRLRPEAETLSATAAAAAGDYVNEELGYTLTLTPDGDALNASSEGPYGRWSGSATPIAPGLLRLSGEWFAGVLRLRCRGDDVEGFEFSTVRTYGLPFARIAAAQI